MQYIFLLLLFLPSLFADVKETKGSVIDTKNHLEWMDSTKIEEKEEIWKMANSYCHNLRYLQHSDWHTPSLDEFKKLLEVKKYFRHLDDSVFWTSQEDSDDDLNAVEFYIGNGHVSTEDKCEKESVMCVRYVIVK